MTDIQKEEKERAEFEAWRNEHLRKNGLTFVTPFDAWQAARRSQPEGWISGAPKDPGLVVKRWRNGSLWAGRFNGSEKMASCDFHLNLPPIAAAPDGREG